MALRMNLDRSESQILTPASILGISSSGTQIVSIRLSTFDTEPRFIIQVYRLKLDRRQRESRFL